MSRQTSEALTERVESTGVESGGLAARLASVEQAYDELLARVRGYERERAEIRSRLERILSQIDAPVDRSR
jgi:uncharacterized coiled-coil DUF342 family protein